jgi:hypothetical protein
MVFLILTSKGQSFEIISFSQLAIPYSTKPVYHSALTYVKGKKGHYQQNYIYSTCNMHLFKDSTYVFYYVSEFEYHLSAGNYITRENVFILQWDSMRTQKIVADYELYKHYFKFKPPSAFKIQKMAYVLDENTLTPFHSYISKDRIEILEQSKSMLKNNVQLDQFKSIYYSDNGKKLTINYDQQKKFSFPTDSIWGFVVSEVQHSNVYRVVPRGINWFGFPGIKVVQTDYFIIYNIGDSRGYSYFSKDLDSKIYALNLKNLQTVFADKPDFIEAVKKEFNENQMLSVLDKHVNSYRIVEIYKACLEAETQKLKLKE